MYEYELNEYDGFYESFDSVTIYRNEELEDKEVFVNEMG